MAEEGDLFEKYWALRVESAQAKLDAAQEIIKHNPTRGSVGEAVVRNLLAEFLPRRWEVGTGFIMGLDKKPSNQVDVLVYDALSVVPLYRDGELVVLSPTAAAIALEVKSILRQDSLADAVKNVRSVKRVDGGVTCIVFAFESLGTETMKDHLADEVAKAKVVEDFDAGALPDTIYMVEKKSLFTRAPAGEAHVYSMHAPEAPVVRFLVTQVLAALKLTNLQPFMTGVTFGAPVHTI